MRILVAGDDPGSRLVAESTVRGLGHECLTAEDGDQAWRMFNEFSPDVVVSDIAMPGLDGIEVCRRIRASDKCNYTYIVLVTALSNPADVLAGMRAGADDYITKPLDSFDLEVRLLAASRVTALHADLARAADELTRQANTDSLTGVANRAAFDYMLPRMLNRRRTSGRAGAVMLLDLDSFKPVNDRYGHRVGDQLLRLTAERLTGLAREDDLVGRLGGDEFAVIVDDTDARGALVIAERITAALSEPADLGGIHLTPGVSLGVYVHDGMADTKDVLVRADTAMYAAKTSGGGYQLFDPERHRGLIDRYELEIDLREAPRLGQLVLHYQPIVDLATQQILAVEALVRWNHPTRGLLSPIAFIEIAEDSGAIVDLGRWVLAQGCADARLLSAGMPDDQPFKVAINVSRLQLINGTLVDDVSETLHLNGLAPDRLALEITETALMQDTDDMMGLLHKLKAIGVELAMDDFGTGYSSLAQLRTMPIDVLKIDKAFVDGIAQSEEEWSLATAIIRLAGSLGKRTLAEGIEYPAQLAHLRTLGCEQGQGYLFARPMPLAEMIALLAEQSQKTLHRGDLPG